MSSQTIIIAAVLLVLVVAIRYFYAAAKTTRSSHLQTLVSLEHEIELHENQISIRQQGLQRYNFLQYNLGESLVVQKEIAV